MTHETYIETAKFILNYKNNTTSLVSYSLELAQKMIPRSKFNKMQSEEAQKELIKLGWEIYQFNNSEI